MHICCTMRQGCCRAALAQSLMDLCSCKLWSHESIVPQEQQMQPALGSFLWHSDTQGRQVYHHLKLAMLLRILVLTRVIGLF